MSYPEPGAAIGDLVVERELGRGAFGRVYLAHDRLIGRNVALKVVEGPPEAKERILREARLVGRLLHPNIVTLHRVHLADAAGVWCFEFEYVDGGTLQELLAQGPLAPQRAKAIAVGLVAALEAAHRSGCVHGDVKPRNILIARDGTPKLADFGLGRVIADAAMHASDADAVAGTPVYMAPEVLMGEPVTPPADVWSLGVVLYAMACGRLPFSGPHLHALLQAVQHLEPAPPPTGTPPEIVAAIRACLAKRVEERPRDAAEVAKILGGHGVSAVQPPSTQRTTNRLRGRDREVALLDQRIDEARTRRKGSCTLILGEAGVGKTALAAEAARTAGASGFLWVTAKVNALEGVVRPLLRSARLLAEATTLGSAHVESTRETIDRLLDTSDKLRLDATPALATLERTLSESLASHALGITIDDLQEGNADDMQTVVHVASRLVADGAMVLLLTRSDTPGNIALGPYPFIESMVLERLSREDSFALLEDHAEKSIEPGIARLIHEKSAGNPRHLLELYRHLIESGSVSIKGGRVVGGARLVDAELPRRLRDVVASRLDRLTDEERELLEVAAVAGNQFDGTIVAAVAQRPVLEVLRRLQKIYRERGLVLPLDQGYRFSSPIVRDVIYGDLAADLRRMLHRSFTARLSPETSTEQLAVHWEQAGEVEQAAPLFIKAARQAARRLEKHRAIDLATRAGLRMDTLTAETARAHAELLLTTSGFHYDLGLREGAETIATALINAAEQGGDESLRLRALVRRYSWRYRAEGDGAVDLNVLGAAARDLSPCTEKIEADYLRGIILKFRGDLQGATEALNRATESLRSFPHEGLRSSITDQRASIAMRQGRLAEAETLYREAASVAESCGRSSHAAASEVNRCLVAFQRGAVEGLERDLGRVIRLLELEGSTNLASHARLILAMVHRAAGNLAEATRVCEAATEVLRNRNYWLGLGDGLVLQGGIWMAMGRYVQARLALVEAEAIGRRDGFLQARCAALAWQAKCHCAMGEIAAAEEKANECVTRALATTDTAVRSEAAALLAEAMLMGLDRPLDVEALIAGREDTPAGALVMAGRAWRTHEAEGLREAAKRLRRPDVGDRRAEMHVLAALLDVEALHRLGNRSEAQRLASAALEDARRLGHVWLEAALRDRT